MATQYDETGSSFSSSGASNSSNSAGGGSDVGISAGIAALAGRRDNEFRRREARRAENLNLSIRDRDLARSYARADTAYQRQVSDMRAAGLNPILAASGGFGGNSDSFPGASNAGVVADIQNETSNALATALQVKMNNAQIKQMAESAEAAEAQGDKSRSDIEVNEFIKSKLLAETNNTKVNTARTTYDLPRASTKSQFWSFMDDFAKSAATTAKSATSRAEQSYKDVVQYLFGSKAKPADVQRKFGGSK